MTTRRKFLKATALGLGSTTFFPTRAKPAEAPSHGAGKSATAQATDRPNLVFVFSDQQSFDMLGCYGNKQISTPHLDAFATEGIRFNHCVSSQPVCSPYRGMLLSGQHPLRCGVIKNDVRMEAGQGQYFGEVLRDAGYRLGYFGKWHLYGGDRNRPIPPGPFRYGFDQTFLSNNCTLSFDAQHAWFWDAQGRKQLYGDWEPYAQTRQALQFIEENSDRPFALFLSWHPPHNWGHEHEGYNAPEDLLRLYDPAQLTLRANVADTPRVRRMYQGHMALCTSLDRAFGWLTAKLREKGLDENTIVVYTSDHGDMLLSHGWTHNKSLPENESCHVPLLIRWPRALKPRVSELLFGTLDFMPTLLGLLGLAIPTTCQGRNLADAIRAAHDDAIESVPLFFFALNWRGVYTRRHTYAFDLPAPEDEEMAFGHRKYACLYDHENDPREQRNLWNSPEHQAIRDHLHAQALAWMKTFGDTGLLFRDLIQQVMAEEDIGPRIYREDGPFGQGRLKGSPLNVLNRRIP